MSTDVEVAREPSPADAYTYREVSWPAVISVVMAVLGLLSLPFAIGANPTIASGVLYGIAPGFGLICGLRGLIQTGRYPQDFTGRPLAWAGTVLSTAFLIAGWGGMFYVYQTEVPEGYARLDYAELQPPPDQILVPDTARKFDQQEVFVKGYMFPGAYDKGIHQFMLCRDNGECCFGGQPKLTDMIYVRLKDTQSISYSTRIRKLTGKFRIQPGQALHDLGTVFYYLEDAECLQ